MTPSEILRKTKESNISLWIEQGKLNFRAPQGVLTDDLRRLIVSNRDGIISILKDGLPYETGSYPLTYNQQSLWFIHQMAPQASSYNVAASCRILSEINTDALLTTFEKIASRHSILRTTYHLDLKKQEPFQKVHEKSDINFKHIDASTWNEKELKERVESYYKIPFDLENGPIFRVHLFTLDRADHIILLTIHHIACDALSLKIILNDFSQIYESEIKGTALNLPAPSRQYYDYLYLQKQIVESQEADRLLSFWKKNLHNAYFDLNLPADFERPRIQTNAGSSYFFNVEGQLYDGVRQLIKNTGTTLYGLLISLYQILLFRYSGQNDLLVGTPSFGRLKKEYHSTCGYFINPVIMRAGYDDSITLRAFIQKNSKNIFEALEYQEYPFPLLIEKLGIERNPIFSPAFQVLFNLINKKVLGIAADFLCPAESSEPVKFGTLDILPFPISQQEGQYDQTLEIIDTEKSLYCVLKYNTDLFKPETSGRIVEDFQNLLKEVIRDPERPLKEYLNNIQELIKRHDESVVPKYKIAVSSTYTIELIEDTLTFWMSKLNINPEIVFTPYNQVFQQLLDPTSIFSKNNSGVNLIFIRFDDWLGINISSIAYSEEIPSGCIESLQNNVDEFLMALESASKISSAANIVFICPSAPGLLSRTRYYERISIFEQELVKKMNSMSGVYPVTSNEILNSYPVGEYYEPMGEEVGHIPYTQEFYTALSTIASRRIFSITGKPFKVIAVDCDNTLWSGVVGEDGPLGVRVDENKKWFHQFLINQVKSGMLICLCSKNVEPDVWEVFDNHPDMVLKRDHVTASRINWNHKSQNLRELAQELNLGLDSFIFIDDNPIECAEVRDACHEILTIQLPDESVDTRHFFSNLWVFDHLKVTEEDTKRSEFYKKDKEREQFLRKTSDFSDFIKGLNLEIDLEGLKENQVQRFAQMTQRTNQFNLSTIRRTESDVEKLNRESGVLCYAVSVKDRFGDYGLVGAMISKKEENRLDVDTMLLSCRALGKGVEHKMLSHLGKAAKDNGLEEVRLFYRPTKKNIPIREFLSSVAEKYKTQMEDGLVYNIPSDVAAKIEFTPGKDIQHDIEISPLNEKATESAGESRKELADLLVSISNDLSDIKQIHAEVHPNKTGDRAAHLLDSTQATAISSKIMAVWCDVLGIQKISQNDNFFEIGGKSVLIPLIVIQLKKQYNINISIVDMLQYPTVAALIQYITSSDAGMGGRIQEQAGKQKTAFLKQKERLLGMREKIRVIKK